MARKSITQRAKESSWIEINARLFERAARDPNYSGPQYTNHHKPNKGGPSVHCEICGALGMREGAFHHAILAGEHRPPGAIYVAHRSVAYGTDSRADYHDALGNLV